MANLVKGYGAKDTSGKLEYMELDVGPLGAHQVDVKMLYCGLCHSDYSMMKNDWGITKYPFMPGHENIGEISAVGAGVTSLKVGDIVGVGWHSGFCMRCKLCMSGEHNLCKACTPTIVGHNGGFADKLRCDEAAAVPIPKGMDLESAGPLLCGGITVFNPLVQYEVPPTASVAVIGIGGLGHLALQFCRAWGCEVTAFTSSPSKEEEAKKFGAHKCINSRDSAAIKAAAGSFDIILSTVNVSLDWSAYMETLKPKGRLHLLGAVLEPIPVSVPQLLFSQLCVSSTPVGSPETIRKMLEFAALHNIKPQCEVFDLKDWEKAFEKMENNTIRYRAVLKP